MKYVYICVRVEEGYLEIVEDYDAYLSEEEALAALPSPTLDELRKRWQEINDDADRAHTNRLRRERRALAKHHQQEEILQAAGLSAGKAPKVNTNRESGEFRTEFSNWLGSTPRWYFQVLRLEVRNQGEPNDEHHP